MSIEDHPGNLGATRGNLLAIHHADWPAYPEGENCYEALLQLTAFPLGIGFIAIDDIDKALLFIADVKCGNRKEPFDEKNFHLAVWHGDLSELQRLGYIDGIAAVTERQWNEARWKKLHALYPEGLFRKVKSGELVRIEEPNFDTFDDSEDWKPFVTTPSGKIHVTTHGRAYIHDTLKAHPIDISAGISEKVDRLFRMSFFDTCIREACVQLEHELKKEIGSAAWGDKLTESFIEHLRGKKLFLESFIRTFRQELRSVFKLIRNDYMHNLSEADEATALVILTRIARVRSILVSEPKG